MKLEAVDVSDIVVLSIPRLEKNRSGSERRLLSSGSILTDIGFALGFESLWSLTSRNLLYGAALVLRQGDLVAWLYDGFPAIIQVKGNN